jgi:hypothetical protein
LQDPIGFAGGDVNLYGYVGASPLMFVDPWGLCSEDGVEYWNGLPVIRPREPSTLQQMLWGLGMMGAGAVIEYYRGVETFYRYVSENSDPNSGWLTRGENGKAPYGKDFDKAKDALQIPKTPTSVKKVRVTKGESVVGPRSASGNPQWGSGGGPEYYRGSEFPN